MKRWYIFFVLVGILVALGGLGVFSGSLDQQTAGPAGASKMIFLTLLALGGAAYAGWLAFSSSARKRREDDAKDDAERGPGQHGMPTDGPQFTPPPPEPEKRSPGYPGR
jgi:hypothetical protein